MNGYSRREVLSALAITFGTTVFAPLVRASTGEAANGGTAEPPLFTAAQESAVAALAEQIIPTTDTPGAIAAGVPAFIVMMFNAWFTEAEQRRFLAGLENFTGACEEAHAYPFPELDTAMQERFLKERYRLAGTASTDREPHFLEALRQLVIAGYYTSEIGMTVERRYIPTPGRYDGSYRYCDVGTLFTY